MFGFKVLCEQSILNNNDHSLKDSCVTIKNSIRDKRETIDNFWKRVRTTHRQRKNKNKKRTMVLIWELTIDSIEWRPERVENISIKKKTHICSLDVNG